MRQHRLGSGGVATFVGTCLCIFPSLGCHIDTDNARLAVELAADVTLRASAGEPPFTRALADQGCFVDRVKNTGFTVVLPGFARGVKGKDGIGINATFISPSELRCHVPKLITAGNTSIVAGNGTASAPYAPAYFESFALISPAFGRRPYQQQLLHR